MKKRNKKFRKYNLFIILPILFLMTIGFAYIAVSSNINITAKLDKIDFDIYFDNVHDKLNDTENVNLFDVSAGRTSLYVIPELYNIGDKYFVYFDIVNDGNIAVGIDNKNFYYDTNANDYLDIEFNYASNDVEVRTEDVIPPHSRINVYVSIEFSLSSLEESELSDVSFEKDVSINFDYSARKYTYMNDYFYGVNQDIRYMTSNSINVRHYHDKDEYSGLYLYAPTKNDENPIFFYRGDSTIENHAIFGGFCWLIIRTTSEGNFKLLYNGTPDENGYCQSGTHAGAAFGFDGPHYIYVDEIEDLYYQNARRRTIEEWFSNNLLSELSNIEDEEFCETIVDINHKDEMTLDYSCTNGHKFSVANGNITYPVAELDYVEAMYAGLDQKFASYSYELKTTRPDYWFNSGINYYIEGIYANFEHSYFQALRFQTFNAFDTCDLTFCRPYFRPVIHVKISKFNTGTGKTNDPYRIG